MLARRKICLFLPKLTKNRLLCCSHFDSQYVLEKLMFVRKWASNALKIMIFILFAIDKLKAKSTHNDLPQISKHKKIPSMNNCGKFQLGMAERPFFFFIFFSYMKYHKTQHRCH